jgi:putative transposase
LGAENPTCVEERVANELKLKLGIRVSPRTVHKYLTARGPSRKRDPEQRWLIFVHNHAQAIVVSDFMVVVAARFRILYVLVIMELGTRSIRHHIVVIHARDSIFSKELDKAVTNIGVSILRTPVRAPYGRWAQPSDVD